MEVDQDQNYPQKENENHPQPNGAVPNDTGNVASEKEPLPAPIVDYGPSTSDDSDLFITSPEHIEQSIPPPSYQEFMGHQMKTSVVQEVPTADIPPLAYVDIMPMLVDPGNIRYKVAPKFDKFSGVVEAANAWLRVNIGYAVWKCETVERKVDPGASGKPPIVELEKMTIHHSTHGFNVFVRGLRLWLVRKMDHNPPQQLGLYNVVPDKLNLDWSTASAGHFMLDDPFYHTPGSKLAGLCTYDSMKDTIEKLNVQLKISPLPGTILNVESAMMKSFEFSPEFRVDPDSTTYTSEHKLKRLTQILRVFYVKGSPSYEQIHMQDIFPRRINSQQSQVIFESWGDVSVNLAGWLAGAQGVRVVNVQTLNGRYRKTKGHVDIMSDCTDEVQTIGVIRDYVKLIRVFYTTGSSIPMQPVAGFSSRLFLPVRTGKTTFEGMTTTMMRIDRWLKAAGCPIYSVETVQYLIEPGRLLGVELNKCSWKENPTTGNTFVTAVRVYFPHPYQEPDPRSLLPAVAYNPKQGSGLCTII